MNLLYTEYPDEVNINGATKKIITDFKDWIKFADMLLDQELSDNEKFGIMTVYYLDAVSFADYAAAVKQLINFFTMSNAKGPVEGENKDGSDRTHCKRLYDYKFDARYIIAGFFHDYRIDLTKERMHWWKFCILLDGLSSETEFKQRVMYRNINIAEIKDVTERRRIERIQRMIVIPQSVPTAFEIGGLF